jgi:hypothetical protein
MSAFGGKATKRTRKERRNELALKGWQGVVLVLGLGEEPAHL